MPGWPVTDWTSVLEEVAKATKRLGCTEPWYRGQSNANWPLIPKLGRLPKLGIREERLREGRLHFDFRTLGAHLIPPGADDWEILVLMQHHGVPTRLLDWTETFAVAAYFAVHCAQGDAALWILNPYRLNLDTEDLFETAGSIPCFPLSKSYSYYCLRDFVYDDDSDRYLKPVQAVAAASGSTRVRLQRAAFTLHDNLERSLESLHPKAVCKIIIPAATLPEASKYLEYCGVNELSLFQDLDALARYLVEKELKN